jgi:hypothetical protein
MLTVLGNEVQLMEVAVGYIKIFGGTARTVSDEPLALKVANTYFPGEGFVTRIGGRTSDAIL